MNKIRITFMLIVMAMLNAIVMGACTKEDEITSTGGEPSIDNETTISLTDTEWQRIIVDTILAESDVVVLSEVNNTLKFTTNDYGTFYQKITTFSNVSSDTLSQNHDDMFDYTFDGKQYGTIHMRNIQNLPSITMEYTFEYSDDGKTLTISANGKEGEYKLVNG